MGDLTDEAIVEQVQRGDQEAFGLLIERYEGKLKGYGRRFSSSGEDIEDVVQEVFIKVYTNLQSFDIDRRFSPWIYRIAHNTYVNMLRKQQRAGLPFFDADTLFPQPVAPETADDAAIHRELSEQMGESLHELDPKYKDPLVLFFYEELSYQDISEVLKIPVTTVGVRINRAKEKLKQHYQAKTETV
ncbi:MAG: RNA polymerase sigma factor [Patescibacteria group bacterium]